MALVAETQAMCMFGEGGWTHASLREGSSCLALRQRQSNPSTEPTEIRTREGGGFRSRRCSVQLLTRLLSGLFTYSAFCRSPARGQDGQCRSSSHYACCTVSPKHSPDSELTKPDQSLPGCRDSWGVPQWHSGLPQLSGNTHGFLS